jgi:catechol 2,3-dioxygenase-like lactoylglutathione lyase family enzyme
LPMETIEQNAIRGQGDLGGPFTALHHVALVTNDMKKTVAFYRDVLGGKVVMAHRMPRPGNERHYFISVTPTAVFAFFEFPDAELPSHKGATLPSTGRALDHIAFFAPDDATFGEWYRRLDAAGVEHLTPIRELGIGIRAFFFADPNGIVLEVMSPPRGGDISHFPSSVILDDPDPAY